MKQNGLSKKISTDKNSIKDEFNIKIGRLTKSRAYLDYCEEVYGYRTYLFNMMDKAQIDFILNLVSISKEDTILDLGCGSGSILNLLVLKYGCIGIGIDKIDSDIVKHGSEAITYINGDIDRISDYDVKPTITLSIDSMYFSSDLNDLVKQLSSFKNNKMYFFYSEYLFDETTEDKSILKAKNTKLAVSFKNNGISFKTVDYSQNEHQLYLRSLTALKKHEIEFALEGNTDLYEQKLKDDTLGMELYNKGLASRYLYIIN